MFGQFDKEKEYSKNYLKNMECPDYLLLHKENNMQKDENFGKSQKIYER